MVFKADSLWHFVTVALETYCTYPTILTCIYGQKAKVGTLNLMGQISAPTSTIAWLFLTTVTGLNSNGIDHMTDKAENNHYLDIYRKL